VGQGHRGRAGRLPAGHHPGPRPFDRPYQGAENPLDVSGLSGPLLVIYQLAFAVTNLAVLVGAVSLVVRFRRARGGERQQLRWVALAAALALLGSVVVLALSVLGASPALLGWVAGCYFAILPLAIGAAILRYRLYDLDGIISRTLAYGLLTVLLGLGYAAVVLGLGRLLPQGSSLGGGKPHPGAGPGDQGDLAGEVVGRVHGCLLLFRREYVGQPLPWRGRWCMSVHRR